MRIVSSVVFLLLNLVFENVSAYQEKRAYVCERALPFHFDVINLKITCPDPYVIHVKGGNFGRRNIDIDKCASRDQSLLDDTTCINPLTFSELCDDCDNKTMCEILPTEQHYNDNCDTIYKILDITYFCAPQDVEFPCNPAPSPPTTQPSISSKSSRRFDCKCMTANDMGPTSDCGVVAFDSSWITLDEVAMSAESMSMSKTGYADQCKYKLMVTVKLKKGKIVVVNYVFHFGVHTGTTMKYIRNLRFEKKMITERGQGIRDPVTVLGPYNFDMDGGQSVTGGFQGEAWILSSTCPYRLEFIPTTMQMILALDSAKYNATEGHCGVCYAS